MGQKVNPKGFRLYTVYKWSSNWFATSKQFNVLLEQDIKLRKFLSNKLKEALIEKVEIERSAGNLIINVFSGKPGVIIGRAGSGIEDLKREVVKKFKLNKVAVNLNVKEVERPALSASLVMQSVIADLEKRIAFRRAVKQAMSRVERAGALGVKIIVSGRLNGADIARKETLFSGKIPLHTLRANIDYCRGVARTIYGAIGVKVWIYKGEVFNKDKTNKDQVTQQSSTSA